MKSTIDDLLARRSIRKYSSKQITAEELDTVLEVGKYAPTAMNRQSPLMVAVQDQETVAELSRLNAAVMNASSDPFYGAPTVVVVLAKRGDPNSVQDASLVMGNLMNAAYAIGLGSCWINRAYEVFETVEGKKLLEKWGLDDSWIGVGNCILGYPEETPKAGARKDGYVVYVK